MYVCLYVCMYVCIYVCMYICMYVYMYVYMYVCMYVCMYVRMYVCKYVFMWKGISVDKKFRVVITFPFCFFYLFIVVPIHGYNCETNNPCKDVEEFFPHESPNKYIQCGNSLCYEQVCPENTVWDQNVTRCV